MIQCFWTWYRHKYRIKTCLFVCLYRYRASWSCRPVNSRTWPRSWPRPTLCWTSSRTSWASTSRCRPWTGLWTVRRTARPSVSSRLSARCSRRTAATRTPPSRRSRLLNIVIIIITRTPPSRRSHLLNIVIIIITRTPPSRRSHLLNIVIIIITRTPPSRRSHLLNIVIIIITRTPPSRRSRLLYYEYIYTVVILLKRMTLDAKKALLWINQSINIGVIIKKSVSIYCVGYICCQCKIT